MLINLKQLRLDFIMAKVASIACLLFVLCNLVACSGTDIGLTEKGALTGSALGAGLGAIIGHETGNTGAGVAIGAAAGALGGGLLGNQFEKQDQQLDAREQRIRNQQAQLEENRRLMQELKSLGVDARSSSRGVVVNLPDVLFEFDKARLTPRAERTAREIAGVVRGVKNRSVSIEGHTDSVGTVSYNQELSERRAEAVANALVANGVSRRRILSRGFGENAFIASNRTESGRARNRRVEVIIENR